MVRSRSAVGRSRRYYRALDLGFVPPPSGVELNHPSVSPPSGFFYVESSNHYDIVPPPPWGHRGIFPSTMSSRSGLWADMDDYEDEVLLVDAVSQYDGLPSYRELLNSTLTIIASLNPGTCALCRLGPFLLMPFCRCLSLLHWNLWMPLVP